jgi:hypothetical protein
MSDYDQARDQARASDREMNAARTFDEMRDAVHRRRLIRAAMEFQHTMRQFEERSPVGPIHNSFPFRRG